MRLDHHCFSNTVTGWSDRVCLGSEDHFWPRASRARTGPTTRQSAFKQQKHNTAERLLPFVTTYHPAGKKLKQIVMENWNFIENQPLLKTIFKTPPIISYKRGKSLVKAKPSFEGFDNATQPQKPHWESV